jgi:pimeloyl-ACP methyl ester carboxylesterase
MTAVAADAARIARLAADAAAPVHLVGHSYGGAVALRVALYHPDLVASVAVYEPVAMRVLFDYNPKHRAAAEVAELAGAIGRELNGGNLERAAHRFYDYWSGAGSWPGFPPERRVGLARRMPVIHAHFAALIRDVVGLRDYRSLDAPVLYLTGRATRMSARRIGELLRYALPSVDSLTFDAMGHLGPVTHPGIVADAIASFIGDRAPPRAMDERKAA